MLCEYEDEVVKNTFYEQLRTTIEQVPSHNFLIILSDMNARMGLEDVQYTYNTSTNYESRFIEMMEEYQLLAANSQFRNKRGKLWTWMSPIMTKHQRDYILVRKKWRNSIRNCEACNTFISLGSDHRIVVANVTLSLRASKQIAKRKPKYIWRDLRDQDKLQERYAVEVQNKFNIQGLDEETISERYERLVEIINVTAVGCMRQVPKLKMKLNYQDPRIIREAITSAYKELVKKKCQSNLTLYKQKKI